MLGRARHSVRAAHWIQRSERRAPVLRSTNAKRGHQPIATAEGGRSDAPYLDQPVHGTDACPNFEIEASTLGNGRSELSLT